MQLNQYITEHFFLGNLSEQICICAHTSTMFFATFIFCYTHGMEYKSIYKSTTYKSNILSSFEIKSYIILFALITIIFLTNLMPNDLYLYIVSTLISFMGFYIAHLIIKLNGYIYTATDHNNTCKTLSNYAYNQIFISFLICLFLLINYFIPMINNIEIDIPALLTIMWTFVYNRIFCDIQSIGTIFTIIVAYALNVSNYTVEVKCIMFSMIVITTLLVTDHLHNSKIIFSNGTKPFGIIFLILSMLILISISHFDLSNKDEYEFSITRFLIAIGIYVPIFICILLAKDKYRSYGWETSLALTIVLFTFIFVSPINKINNTIYEPNISNIEIITFAAISLIVLFVTLFVKTDQENTHNKRYYIIIISFVCIFTYYVLQYFNINTTYCNIQLSVVFECIIKLFPTLLLSLIHYPKANTMLHVISPTMSVLICLLIFINNKTSTALTIIFAILATTLSLLY